MSRWLYCWNRCSSIQQVIMHLWSLQSSGCCLSSSYEEPHQCKLGGDTRSLTLEIHYYSRARLLNRNWLSSKKCTTLNICKRQHDEIDRHCLSAFRKVIYAADTHELQTNLDVLLGVFWWPPLQACLFTAESQCRTHARVAVITDICGQSSPHSFLPWRNSYNSWVQVDEPRKQALNTFTSWWSRGRGHRLRSFFRTPCSCGTILSHESLVLLDILVIILGKEECTMPFWSRSHI